MNLWLKHMHIQDLMAGIYYFSLASQNSKLERNKAFSAEIILYFIWNKGNYLTFLEFSQFRRRSILQQKEIYEAYTFHIIYTIQCTKHKNNVLLQIYDSLCIKTQENHGKHKCSSIAMQIFMYR